MPSRVRRSLAWCLTLSVASSAAGCCLDYWGEVDEHSRLSDLRLDDVGYVGYGNTDRKPLAFGSKGLVVLDGERIDLGTDVDFHGIAESYPGAAIVGAMGTIAVYVEVFDNLYGGEPETGWTVYQADTEVTLVAAAYGAGGLVAVGDGVVVLLDESAEVVPPPEGGWGSLRAVVGTDYSEDGRTFMVGDAGVAWVIDPGDAVSEARRLDLGVDGDVRAGGFHVDDGHLWLVGEGGLALREHASDDWRRVDVGTTQDFVDFSVGAALTSEGELWDPARQRRIADVPWARGIGEGEFDYDDKDGDAHEDPDVLIVGDAGRFAILEGC